MCRTRVLICEDEGLTSLRLSITLKRSGYQIAGTAVNGLEAVSEAARLQPDIILLDVEMPEMDGLSALRRIMETHPTAVLMVTAYTERETLRAAWEAGASGFLLKPVTDSQVVEAIEAALARYREGGVGNLS